MSVDAEIPVFKGYTSLLLSGTSKPNFKQICKKKIGSGHQNTEYREAIEKL